MVATAFLFSSHVFLLLACNICCPLTDSPPTTSSLVPPYSTHIHLYRNSTDQLVTNDTGMIWWLIFFSKSLFWSTTTLRVLALDQASDNWLPKNYCSYKTTGKDIIMEANHTAQWLWPTFFFFFGKSFSCKLLYLRKDTSLIEVFISRLFRDNFDFGW